MWPSIRSILLGRTQPSLPAQENFAQRLRRWLLSIHADTHIHRNDRAGLEKLARYGARGAIAQRAPVAARRLQIRKLVLTGLELLRKLAALVPPSRLNLVRFFWSIRSQLEPLATPTSLKASFRDSPPLTTRPRAALQ
jgi:hypothetical protein